MAAVPHKSERQPGLAPEKSECPECLALPNNVGSSTDLPGERAESEQGDPHGEENHEAQMARLFREHNQSLIRFLMTRVDSEQEARDVAQEAYVRMLQLDTQGAVSFLSAYLFKTAANIAIDRVRHRYVRRRADGELAREHRQAASPDTILQARQELEIIDRLVQELPPRCRQAFYLHRLHDMSPPDIAAHLGVSKRMVHNYLVCALVHLRAHLQDRKGESVGEGVPRRDPDQDGEKAP